jgi:hypothetical protein
MAIYVCWQFGKRGICRGEVAWLFGLREIGFFHDLIPMINSTTADALRGSGCGWWGDRLWFPDYAALIRATDLRR